MFSNEDLVKNSGYWMDKIQNDLYFELNEYMKIHDLNKTELANHLGFTKGYISQILNGNFNFSIKKLIDLSLSINKVPKIEYNDIDKELSKLDKINSVKLITLNTSDFNISNKNISPYKYA